MAERIVTESEQLVEIVKRSDALTLQVNLILRDMLHYLLGARGWRNGLKRLEAFLGESHGRKQRAWREFRNLMDMMGGDLMDPGLGDLKSKLDVADCLWSELNAESKRMRGVN